MESFTVYDFRGAERLRRVGDPKEKVRLERYAFVRRGGSFSLEVQVGWPGGTGHWDGAGNSFPLPEEWFEGSFALFLQKLTRRYPAEDYGYGPEELAAVPGLGEFLGFGEGARVPQKRAEL